MSALLGFLIFVTFIAAVLSTSSIQNRKLQIAVPIATFIIIALCIVGLVYEIPDNANDQVKLMQRMEQSVGISNDEEYNVIISDSISTTSELHATMFLSVGSINATEQDSLRMGYVAPNGASHIIKVPIAKIVFTQKVNALPSGSFHFTNWYEGETFQSNVDKNLKEINITLTPDEFQKLIQ
jgi:hypothetical protein